MVSPLRLGDVVRDGIPREIRTPKRPQAAPTAGNSRPARAPPPEHATQRCCLQSAPCDLGPCDQPFEAPENASEASCQSVTIVSCKSNDQHAGSAAFLAGPRAEHCTPRGPRASKQNCVPGECSPWLPGWTPTRVYGCGAPPDGGESFPGKRNSINQLQILNRKQRQAFAVRPTAVLRVQVLNRAVCFFWAMPMLLSMPG